MAAELCSACRALAQLALLSGEITITCDIHTNLTKCFLVVPLMHRATSSCLEVQMILNGSLGLYCRVYMQCEVADL